METKSCPTCQTAYPIDVAVCPADGSRLLDPTLLPEGTVIGEKYRILTKIGLGELGVVYRAVRRESDALRALKVMRAELMSDELLVRRFKQEAVQARNFLHPHAVFVEGVEETEDGRPFIVMEYIPGQSLKDLLEKEGRLPLARVSSIVKQVASVLDAAHRVGIIHQDLTPGNIMLAAPPSGHQAPPAAPASATVQDPVASSEQVKVLNCALARMKESHRRHIGRLALKETGILMGTPEYFSPELAVGKCGEELDGRSDLYSLGVIMYLMLCGDLPFRALKAKSSMDILLAHLLTAPTPIAQFHRERPIPDAVADLVMKMLAKKREARPPTGRAVIEELERWERMESLAHKAPAGPQKFLRLAELSEAAEVATEAAEEVAAREDRATSASLPQPRQGSPEIAELPLASVTAVHEPAEVRKPGTQGSELSREARAGPGDVTSMPGPGTVLWRPVPPAARHHFPRWATRLSITILVAGLGAGVWYFTSLRSRLMPQGEGGASSPSPTASSANPRSSRTRAGAADSASSNRAAPGRSSAAESENASSSTTTPNASVVRLRLKATMAEGDWLFQHGEYDRAIRAYESGLVLDPANRELRRRIGRAHSAKGAEAKYLNQ